MAFAFDVPAFKPNVVDTSGQISQDDLERINVAIDRVHEKGSIRPAVLFVSSLDGDSVEGAAEEVFRKWELGEKGKDNGILILAAINDRKVRIEVGYGLEDKVTDYEAAEIIRLNIVPAFRDGDYARGAIEALQKIGGLSSGEVAPLEIKTQEGDFSGDEFLKRVEWWFLSFVTLPAVVMLIGIGLAAFYDPLPYQKIKATNKISLFLALFGVQSKTGLFVKVFLFLNPGIFITLFPIVFSGDLELEWIMGGLGALAVGGSLLHAVSFVRSMFSEKFYRRKVAKERLSKMRRSKPPGSTYQMFGRTYSVPMPSRSSSSSSSSRSSSSGGGRSGGGGASGSW